MVRCDPIAVRMSHEMTSRNPMNTTLCHWPREVPNFQSLRGRLVLLLVLLIVAATAAGTLMIGMFGQSATAQSGQAAAEIGRACRRDAPRFRPISLDALNFLLADVRGAF